MNMLELINKWQSLMEDVHPDLQVIVHQHHNSDSIQITPYYKKDGKRKTCLLIDSSENNFSSAERYREALALYLEKETACIN